MINQIYGRFQQKHDTEVNWRKATNFAPLKGEVVIYDADYDEEQNPSGYRYPRIKVGIWDGESEKTADMLVSNLPFEGGYTNEEINALLKNLNSENITVKQTGLGTTTIGPGTLDLLDSKDATVFSIDSEARVEGGVTDKDMIKEMVGSLGSLTTLTPAAANEAMSLAFGANNNTYAPGTVSFGVNVSAGTKAYYYDAITFGDKPTIQLATTRRGSTYKAPSYPSSVTWEKGDRVTIKTKNYNHVCAGVIESVSGNTITLSAALPFTETGYTPVQFLNTYVYTMPHDRTIVNIDKPEAGVLSLGFGAIAMGGGASNKTKAVGMLSTALGYETEALGSFALSAGKNTKAAYASIATGAGAEAMGETSAAFGTNAKANGAYSVAAGKNTVASGGASTAFGVDSQATKWGAFAVGSAAIAEGQGAIALGNSVKATNTSAVAVGHITEATGVGAFAAGNSTEATAEGAFAEGTYSKATAVGAHAEGGGENADVATTATAAYAHGEGYRTHAKGAHSHTEGALTETIGASSHAEGEGSIAHASRSHAGGYKAITYGANSFAHGDQAQTGELKVLDTYYNITVNPETAQIILDNTAELFTFRKTVVNSKIYPFEYNGIEYQVHITNDAGLDLYWNPSLGTPPDESTLLWQSDIAVNSCPAVDDDGYYRADQAYFECDSSLVSQVIGGNASAVFGNHTQANGTAQFVTGKYNEPNTTSAFIIGNGTSSKRENIHTIDWSGNAWYKGDITAGGTSLQDTKTTATTALANARQAGIRYTDMSLSNLYEGGLMGLQAKSSARYGMALGWGCEVTGDHGMAFGACTKANAGQTAVGKANKPDQKYGPNNFTPIFMVGNGSTDTSANAIKSSNAFVVLGDGTGYLGDKKILVEGDVTVHTLTIGETILTESDVITILDFIKAIKMNSTNL